jgi:hypothetical protein
MEYVLMIIIAGQYFLGDTIFKDQTSCEQVRVQVAGNADRSACVDYALMQKLYKGEGEKS